MLFLYIDKSKQRSRADPWHFRAFS